jgi:hypothetical protein
MNIQNSTAKSLMHSIDLDDFRLREAAKGLAPSMFRSVTEAFNMKGLNFYTQPPEVQAHFIALARAFIESKRPEPRSNFASFLRGVMPEPVVGAIWGAPK